MKKSKHTTLIILWALVMVLWLIDAGSITIDVANSSVNIWDKITHILLLLFAVAFIIGNCGEEIEKQYLKLKGE